MTARRGGIAATLIVRNEARCLARCLSSVRPWVDRMVVVDTGSDDDTAAIAAAGGAEVHHFAWPDSFATARNRALELAGADWHLVIDADEWIACGGEGLRAWCAAGPRLGKVCIHSAFDGDGGTTLAGQSWITRVVPRGARFVGRVHEQIESPLPRVALDLHIDHDGYLDAQLDRKRERNRPLLLAELRGDPGNPYILYQLGKDAQMRGRPAEAVQRFAASLKTTPAEANWRHELVVCHLQALREDGEIDAALAFADDEFPAWQESPDFFFVLGDVLLDRAVADPAGAVDDWLPMACNAWQRCLEIGERPGLEGSVHGRGSHLAQHNIGVVRAQLAAFGNPL